MGKCKLCGVSGKKLIKAHIIPRSLYANNLTDPSGPLRVLSNNPTVFPKQSHIGEYDASLLCGDCEDSFSPYDDYANTFFLNTTPSKIIYHRGEQLAAQYQNVDICKLQLFFMSLLWRMQMTDRPMFNNVDLGPYKDNLTKSLFAKNPDMLPEFDVVVNKFDTTDHGIMGPTRWRIAGVNGYRICFAGHSCWVKFDRRPHPKGLRQIALSNGNPFHVFLREFSSSMERQAMARAVQSRLRAQEKVAHR